MGKERSLVPVKVTPSYCLDLATNGFVLLRSISRDSSCRTLPLKWRGRGLTTLELRIVVIRERIPKNDRFRYCPQAGDTSLFTQDFLGSRDLILHRVLT